MAMIVARPRRIGSEPVVNTGFPQPAEPRQARRDLEPLGRLLRHRPHGHPDPVQASADLPQQHDPGSPAPSALTSLRISSVRSAKRLAAASASGTAAELPSVTASRSARASASTASSSSSVHPSHVRRRGRRSQHAQRDGLVEDAGQRGQQPLQGAVVLVPSSSETR